MMENKFLVKNRDINLHLKKFEDGDSFMSFDQPPNDVINKPIISNAEFLKSFGPCNKIVEVQTHRDFNLIKVTQELKSFVASLENNECVLYRLLEDATEPRLMKSYLSVKRPDSFVP